MNETYTSLWSNAAFDQSSVHAYDVKFFTRFEKNIKHRHQLKIFDSVLANNLSWLDFPIGSSRLIRDLSLSYTIDFSGADVSDAFLAYSSSFGFDCFKRNLFDTSTPSKLFDIVSCNNTLFAFNHDEHLLIVKNLSLFLKPTGVLIFDLPNASLLSFLQPKHIALTKHSS